MKTNYIALSIGMAVSFVLMFSGVILVGVAGETISFFSYLLGFMTCLVFVGSIYYYNCYKSSIKRQQD